jgi:hypothetical protein
MKLIYDFITIPTKRRLLSIYIMCPFIFNFTPCQKQMEYFASHPDAAHTWPQQH